MMLKKLQSILRSVAPSNRCTVRVRDLMNEGQLDDALAEAKNGIKKYPRSVGLLFLYAKIQIHFEQRDEAKTTLLRIAESDTLGWKQSIAAATLLQSIDASEEALEIFFELGRDKKANQATRVFSKIIHILNRLERYPESLSAAIQCCRQGGRIPWAAVMDAIRNTPKAEIIRLHQEMTEHLHFMKGQRNAYYHKLLSLLDNEVGEQDAMLAHMTTAGHRRFVNLNPDIEWLESSPPLRPSFLVIGAMKCATTSLFDEIERHPLCLPAMDKEIQFFQHPSLSDDWYLAHFPKVSEFPGFITGDGSPGYYSFEIVDRVKQIVPDAKLLFSRRNPSKRALSHLRHNNSTGINSEGIEAVLWQVDELQHELTSAPDQAEKVILDICNGRRNGNVFLAMGCYDLLLRQWRRQFPPEQLLEIEFEEFVSEPQMVMNRVFDFVGLEPVEIEGAKINQGSYIKNDPQTQKVIQRLDEFYAAIATL